MKLLVKLNILCIFAIVVFAVKTPKDLQRCKYGDDECILKSMNYIFDNKSKGYPGLNLVQLDPIEIKGIEINQGKESPVNIDLKYRDNKLAGTNSIRAYKVSGFGKDLKGPHEILLKGTQVSLIGPYTVSGKVLVLPISGSGNSNITITDPDIKLTFKGKPVEKDGKTYMHIEGFKMNLDISRMYMHLDNLFNGDKTLGDNMNLFLNENWKDIYQELRGSITKAFGMVFERLIQNVFDKFPYDDLFIQE